MAAEIVLESAGDHGFDLGHLRREGGEELVGLLLREAGYDGLRWRVRVEKKVPSGAETRPVAVVGHKPWCCYLKIKPGDNDSGHYCSLLMPDGLRGEVVYEALKGAEERIDRNWRNGLRQGPPARGRAEALSPPPPAAEPAFRPGPAEEPAAEEGTGRTSLKDWGKDLDKVRLMLLAIYETNQAGPLPSQDDFVNALAGKLGWQGVNRYEVGGHLGSLVRRGYIVGARRGKRPVGYALTAEGKRLIADLLPAGEGGRGPASPAPGVDPVELMQNFAGLAQQFTETSQKLQANRARRAELMAEVERLDADARELTRLVGSPEVQALVQRLLQVTRGPS